MYQNSYELDVLVHGRPVAEYTYQGNIFIEGRRGSEYTLRVRNHTAGRVGVVLSVDGLSIMTGKPASEHDFMYLISPNSAINIPGWRLNNSNVAHFVFGTIPEAYASQMGKPENIGVIGVVVYREKAYHLEPRHFESVTRGGGSYTFGGGMKGIGTGFGRQTEHRVQNVDFAPEATPDARLILRYDDAEGLAARGIVLSSPHIQDDPVAAANPFPADGQGCPRPRGWRG